MLDDLATLMQDQRPAARDGCSLVADGDIVLDGPLALYPDRLLMVGKHSETLLVAIPS